MADVGGRRCVRPSPQGQRRRGAGDRDPRPDGHRDARVRADLRPPKRRTRFHRLAGRDDLRQRRDGPRRERRHRPDGRHPGRQVRAHRAARPGARAAQGGRARRCTTSSASGRATTASSATRCCWSVSTSAGARGSSVQGDSSADSARIARARADMSSSAWPPAIRPVSSWAASALTGRTAPTCAARSRAIAEVLAMERDLEAERVVVVDHPAAAVGEDPALGRSPTERADDLLDVEAGLDGQDDALRRRRGRCRPG